MKRFVLLAASIALGVASAAQAAPDGVPARPRSLGNWTDHDPEEPRTGFEAWSPSDVAGFLQLYDESFFILGYEDGKPAGVRNWKERAQQLAALEQIAAQRGVPTAGRLCMSERPDVLTRMVDDTGVCNPHYGGGGCDWEGDMDGSLGEPETVVKAEGRVTAGTPQSLFDSRANWQSDLYFKRLLVLRPGSASEERHRITANDVSSLSVDQAWRTPPRPGDRYEVRGSFDPAWVRRVSESDHQATVQRFWVNARSTVCGGQPCAAPAMPLDPFAATNTRGFAQWVDRKAIEALRTPGEVPALYGFLFDNGIPYSGGARPAQWRDPYFAANSVIMDVSNPAYRAWRIRYLLYKLGDHGIQPGESTCLSVAYKPGLHTYYDEATLGASSRSCYAANTHAWEGPAQICSDGNGLSGPFHPTTFGPGEYEQAVSNYFREMIPSLVASGYTDLRIITGEAPPFRDGTWNILADDVRRNPKMAGEQGTWLEPRLSSLASLPPVPAASASAPSGSPSSDSATPAASTSSSSLGSGSAPAASGGSSSSASAPTPTATTATAPTASAPTPTAPAATASTPAPPAAMDGGSGGSASTSTSTSTSTASSPSPAPSSATTSGSTSAVQHGYVTGSGGNGGTVRPPGSD